MKKPSSKIREEIARLQEQLRAAETREAERIGRIALKAGLGDVEIDEEALLAALTDVAGTFRRGSNEGSTGKKRTAHEPSPGSLSSPALASQTALPATGETDAHG
ncbi:hypothetical protein ANOBCDAF_04339 [Pleomorphomonas sp. T1.2MG-36]|uniref:conjugal transfer protein TraC n=1 Tax=Pleomorphomonas sp. T1.2MG-36 TaxID=3041167 RepID=UPI0024779571|nr:conjugal transfer protein TraC [Pleomorphomonas sp. T1.2MG-36]CAI9418693.1 hypothetical protein ANOBCDAF_04339 [Pleomorphomonas sp. T1.2MG-36]